MLDDDQHPSTSRPGDGRGMVREWIFSMSDPFSEIKDKIEV